MLGSLAVVASATGGLAPSRALSVSSHRLSGAGPLGCPSFTRMASIRSAICSALCQRFAGSARRARLISRSTSGFRSRTTFEGFSGRARRTAIRTSASVCPSKGFRPVMRR